MKKYRNYAMVLSVFGMALLLVGVTYSFFNFTRTGGVNNLGTGNISFNAEYGTAINLTNIFPISSSDVNNANLTSTTIGITGSTNYSDGEEFLVSIVDVNNTVNGKKIPINYVATYEATTGNTIGTSTDNYFEAEKNSNIYKLTSTGSVVEDKQVLVGFIKTEIGGTLTIKPYIDANRIAITDTPEENSEWIAGRTVFSTTEWNSLSSTPISFKLRTESNEGLWVEEPEPDNVTPESCFTIKPFNLYTVNNNMTQTELSDCTNYIMNMNIGFNTSSAAQDYCLGIGRTGYASFQSAIDYNVSRPGNGYDFDYDYLKAHNIIIEEQGARIEDYDTSCGTDLVIPNKVNLTRYTYNSNITTSGINACINLINAKNWSFSDPGETVESFCSGTGTFYGNTFDKCLYNEWFTESEITTLINNGVINATTGKTKVLYYKSESIVWWYEATPLTSLVFNKDLKIIGPGTIKGAKISGTLDIVIPASVRLINSESFSSIGDPYPNGEPFSGGNFTILGKPSIDVYAIEDGFTVSYGGTCEELHNNSFNYISDNKAEIIFGTPNQQYDVITTDTNTCKVYGQVPD